MFASRLSHSVCGLWLVGKSTHVQAWSIQLRLKALVLKLKGRED